MSATIRRAAMPVRFAVSAAIGLAAFFVSPAAALGFAGGTGTTCRAPTGTALPNSQSSILDSQFALCGGSRGTARPTEGAQFDPVVVALPPLVGIVHEAAGTNAVTVNSLVPAGGDPHSFEPSARDIRAVADAALYLSIGFPFEDRLLARVRALRPDLRVVALTNGCVLRPGDPHLWLSISNRAILVANAAAALGFAGGTGTTCRAPTGTARPDSRFSPVVSCHPSWGYLAADLGVTVIDLEREGHEPTARSLAADLARAKALGVRTVISEPQFSRRTAERFAAELGARIVVIDPLAVDSRASVSNFIEAVTK